MILTPNLLNSSEVKKYYSDMSKGLQKYANSYFTVNKNVNDFNKSKSVLTNPTAFSNAEQTKAAKKIAQLQKQSDYFEKLSLGQSANYSDYAKSQGSNFDFSQISKNKNVLKEICKQYDEANVEINKLIQSNKELKQQQLAGQISDKKAGDERSTNIAKIKDLTNSQEALVAGTREYNAAAADSMEQSQAGASSYKTYTQNQRKMTLSTIAATAAQTALNMAITMGVTALATVVINALSDIVDELFLTREEATELAEEIHSKFQELNDTLQKNNKIVKDSAKRYEKLAKGVNALGKNILLTDEEFNEYNELTNEIAAQFPNLISGYTDTGNAVLTCKNNLEELNKEFERQNELTQDEMIVNSGKALEAHNTKYNKPKVDFIGIMGAFFGDNNYGDIFSSDFYASKQSSSYELKTLEAIFEGNSSTEEIQQKVQDVLTQYTTLKNGENKLVSLLKDAGYDIGAFDNINTIIDTVTEHYDKLQSHYNVLANEIKTGQRSLINEAIMPNLSYSDEYGSIFSELSDEQQELSKLLINSLNLNEIIEENDFGNDIDALTKWINETIILKISDSKSGIQAAYQNILALDASTLPYEDYIEQINKYIDTIVTSIGGTAGENIGANLQSNLDLENEKEYKKRSNDFAKNHTDYIYYPRVRIGVDEDAIGAIYDTEVLNAINEAYGKLSKDEQYKLDYIIKPEFKFTSDNPEEILNEMKALLEAERVKNVRTKGFKYADYSQDINDAQEQLEKYRAAYASVLEAEKSVSGQLSAESQFNILKDLPELAPYIGDIDKLKEKLIGLSNGAIVPLINELMVLQSDITNTGTKKEIQEVIDMLTQYAISVTSVTSGSDGAKTSNQAFEEVKSAYEYLNSIKTDLAETNKIAADTLSSIAELSPEINKTALKYLNGETTSDELLVEVQDYYDKLKEENAEYLLSVNDDMISYAKSAYNVDIADCVSYAEAKKKILASIYQTSNVGKDSNGNELNLSQFYNAETGTFTELYKTYKQSSSEASKAILKNVNQYAKLITQGIDISLGFIDDLDVDSIFDDMFDTPNADIIEMQKNVEDLQHQLAMGWISQSEFNSIFSSYLTILKGKLKGVELSDSDQSTVDSFEETDHSQLQAAEETKYNTTRTELDNSLSDKLLDPRAYFDKITALAKDYYGVNGTIDDPDGTKYAEKQREILEQRSTLYDQEIEKLKADYDDGTTTDIRTLISNMKESAEYWLSGISELADTYETRVKEAFAYFYEQEVAILDHQRDEGIINTAQYARKMLAIWEDYYKDKNGFRQEDIAAEEAAYSATKDAVTTQIEAVQALIDVNSDSYDSQIEALEEANEKIEEQYDSEIDLIDKKIEELEKVTEEEDRQLKIAEAKEALEKAKRNRTRLVYEADGNMTYKTDTDEIKDAQKNYDDVLKEEEINKLEDEKKRLEEEKTKATEANNKKIKSLQETLDDLNQPLNDLVRILQATIAEKFGYDNQFVQSILAGNPDAIAELLQINNEREAAGKEKTNQNDLQESSETVQDYHKSQSTIEQQRRQLFENLNDNIDDTITHWNWKKYDTLYSTPITAGISDNVLAANKPSYTPETYIEKSYNTYTIGDINIYNPVGDSDALAKEIQKQLPNSADKIIFKTKK